MGSSDSIRQCAKIVFRAKAKNRLFVVVSALGGVTDELIRLIDLARSQKPKLIASRLNAIERRHKEVLGGLVSSAHAARVWEEECAPLFKKLRYILTGISFVGEVAEKSYALICSFGERISSILMFHALVAAGVRAEHVLAQRLIRTDSNYKDATVDYKKTRGYVKRIAAPLLAKGIVPVIGGFIGKDTSGDITLLGRGGSDYTASIVAASLDADSVEIWTDVDGIMSADPRLIEKPALWKEIDIQVMAEMAYSGAKVLHPKTIVPAIQKHIPIYIKNTFRPETKGTKVVESVTPGLRGIVVDANQVLLHLTNASMLEGVGFIHGVSEICARHGVPIDVCATSEVSFTISIRKEDYTPKLYKDLSKIAGLEVYEAVAKVCVIGRGIARNANILAKIAAALKEYQLYAVSCGASFNNITLIVERARANDILRLLHNTLFPNPKS
ncbi:MAG: hypothetical protein A2939_00635 [Parcubacteria group bacterium RIFCSPLOWO2_01_FULL_48_18]|nr:MAG: hypothetical protein A2939_00635 [Parcubacteria group bacterium RIFCSPLOWO2_01_FULL_48_18]